MGRVRGWPFDAVNERFRGPLVTFECFVFLGENGPEFAEYAPKLFRYMFEDKHVRFVTSPSLPGEMQEEVQKILRWARNYRPGQHHVREKIARTGRKCR
jgi:hypothetical protein